MPKGPCIVSFGTSGGHGWYAKGTQRIRESLKKVGWGGRIYIPEKYPEGCPRENEARKAFKPYIMKQAAEMGYTQLLWVDSSVWAIRNPQPVFDQIKEIGWYLIQQPEYSTGQWATDVSLPALGITREQSWDIWHLASGFVGLNLEHEKGRAFLDEWYRMATDKTAFIGPRWAEHQKGRGNGTIGFCSDDPRVMGHRAAQTAASVISWKLGMTPTNRRRSHISWRKPGDTVLKTGPEQNKCFIARGGIRPEDLRGVPYG